MGFWNSRIQKARKEHKCLYCGKKITKGEEYYRETGTFEGEFNDYCLCDRCKWFLTHVQNESGDYELGNFIDDLFEYDLIICPECGSYKTSIKLSDDRTSGHCKCRACNHEWNQDLSIDTIKYMGQLGKQ